MKNVNKAYCLFSLYILKASNNNTNKTIILIKFNAFANSKQASAVIINNELIEKTWYLWTDKMTGVDEGKECIEELFLFLFVAKFG